MNGYPGKRWLDLSIVIVTSPFWLIALFAIAALVLAGMGRPVFFRQRRTGWQGRDFELLKFRTMKPATAATQEDADRMTPFGQWLRTTSLDELPELLNVLRGEMSLVGPRPLLPEYWTRYSARHRRRHEVRPGLTGLAQVLGRNSLSWPERFELDVRYVERCSLGLDLWILWRTAAVVLSREGISSAGDVTMPVFMGYDTRPERPDDSAHNPILIVDR